MAERQIFIPINNKVEVKTIEFTWHPGLSKQQKQKSVRSLHEASIEQYNLNNILEVSTKSELSLGRKLSAFNLKKKVNERMSDLESVYQGSKVFENGGPYTDLYEEPALFAKQDKRMTESGNLISFKFEDDAWETEPQKAFYNWLYIKSLMDSFPDKESLINQLSKFDAFTDIEFNHAKSINCQAHALACFKLLSETNKFDILDDRLAFLEILKSMDSEDQYSIF
ncbi:hypothetical protein OAK29_04225 [Gammaproteobacteria bacterium]|nr:hypothetical protein [Gammaproteobacteria bacterium]